MQNQIDWNKITKLVAKGDSEATNQFVELTQKPLFQFCYYLANNKQMAEDLCHDTLIKGITKISSLKKPEQVMAWLKQIAKRQFLDFVKSASQSKVHVNIEDENFDLADSNSGDLTNDQQILAMQALQSINVEERSLVILVDIQGYSYAEAAQAIEIPEGTVKSKVFRARKKMLDFMGTKATTKSS